MVSRIQYVQSGQYSNVIGTSKGNAATCNYGQKNTLCATMVSGIQYVQLWSVEYNMCNYGQWNMICKIRSVLVM